MGITKVNKRIFKREMLGVKVVVAMYNIMHVEQDIAGNSTEISHDTVYFVFPMRQTDEIELEGATY